MNIVISYQDIKKEYTFTQYDFFSSYCDFKHFILDHFGTDIDNLVILRNSSHIITNINKLYIVRDMNLKESDVILINFIAEKATPQDYIGDMTICLSHSDVPVNILIPKTLRICDLYKMIDKETTFCSNYALFYDNEYISRFSLEIVRDMYQKNKGVIELRGRFIEDNK
jgi:hypothetical protein